MTQEDIRAIVREVLLATDDIKEYDALYPKNKKEWNKEAKDLRTHLINLLKNIENDEYQEGIQKIDDVITKLKDWKIKIQKFIQ